MAAQSFVVDSHSVTTAREPASPGAPTMMTLLLLKSRWMTPARIQGRRKIHGERQHVLRSQALAAGDLVGEPLARQQLHGQKEDLLRLARRRRYRIGAEVVEPTHVWVLRRQMSVALLHVAEKARVLGQQQS